MQLGRITIFPIKSLPGIPVETARITGGGILENDRIYAIYDAEGKVVNGKRTPRVHELRCEFDTRNRRSTPVAQRRIAGTISPGRSTARRQMAGRFLWFSRCVAARAEERFSR